jgi:hypothetical protein
MHRFVPRRNRGDRGQSTIASEKKKMGSRLTLYFRSERTKSILSEMRASSHNAGIKKGEQVGSWSRVVESAFDFSLRDKKMGLHPHFQNSFSRNCGEGCALNKLAIRFCSLLFINHLSLLTLFVKRGARSEPRKLESKFKLWQSSRLQRNSTGGADCAIEVRE